MAESITVVANASYPVALDDGRHLHPGEFTSAVVTPRIEQLIADGVLASVAAQPEPAPSKTSPSRPPQGANEQEQ